jgi:hypothetical protein
MRRIPSNEIPLLPVKDIINGESVAFGVGDYGVMVQYMDRNECIFINWNDIILYGVAFLKESENVPVEIVTPTEKV